MGDVFEWSLLDLMNLGAAIGEGEDLGCGEDPWDGREYSSHVY